MHYIVLDLEWNQPTNFNSPVFRQVGDSLLFEVIQIGAAKLNDRFALEDTISVPVRPTYYRSIHPRVRRMTSLGLAELSEADEFPEAMERFADWCGEDYVFVTWGCDDVSVLQQNVDFFRFERPLGKMYDLQRFYADVMKLGASQKALKAAMEELHIEEDTARSFHNAMHDAYYTAMVFQRMPDRENILRYEEQPRKLTHNARRSRFRQTHIVPSVAEALAGETLQTPLCPTCKKPTALRTELVAQATGKYVALSECKQHGALFVKASFSLLPDGRKGMHLSVMPANRQNRAYVHTKQLQYQHKRKRGDFDDYDVEDLRGAMRSNMPFEDA